MTRRTEITLSIATMFVGGMIYVLFRPSELLMFSWFDALGLHSSVAFLRNMASPSSDIFPNWVIYSLPQALWVFSGVVAFHCIWAMRSKRLYWTYVAGFILIALATELGQLGVIVPGHFDIEDVVLLMIAGMLAIFITLPAVPVEAMKNVEE